MRQDFRLPRQISLTYPIILPLHPINYQTNNIAVPATSTNNSSHRTSGRAAPLNTCWSRRTFLRERWGNTTLTILPNVNYFGIFMTYNNTSVFVNYLNKTLVNYNQYATIQITLLLQRCLRHGNSQFSTWSVSNELMARQWVWQQV